MIKLFLIPSESKRSEKLFGPRFLFLSTYFFFEFIPPRVRALKKVFKGGKN